MRIFLQLLIVFLKNLIFLLCRRNVWLIAQVRCFKKIGKTRIILSLFDLERYRVIDVMHEIKKVKNFLAYKLDKFPSKKKKKKKKKKVIVIFYWDKRYSKKIESMVRLIWKNKFEKKKKKKLRDYSIQFKNSTQL